MRTNREEFLFTFGLPKLTSLSLPEIAELSQIPIKALREVYNRGVGAWKTNITSVRMKGTFEKGVNAPRSKKLSKEQWAMGRIYAFVMGTPKVFGKADKDIAEKYNLI